MLNKPRKVIRLLQLTLHLAAIASIDSYVDKNTRARVEDLMSILGYGKGRAILKLIKC